MGERVTERQHTSAGWITTTMTSDEVARWEKDVLAERYRYGSGELPHGTTSGYGYHHCRCAECRAAIAAYTRAYRDRKKALANG